MKDLGPSVELHAAYYGKNGPPVRWTEYKKRYFAEVRSRHGPIDALAERVRAGETITLLCSSACVDAERCHRTLLAKLIAARAR